jgi:hypothetical protein
VLVWNSVPTNSGQPFDVVLGQPDFESSQTNNAGFGASPLLGATIQPGRFSSSMSLSCVNNILFVNDGMHRTQQGWNSNIPWTNGMLPTHKLWPNLDDNLAFESTGINFGRFRGVVSWGKHIFGISHLGGTVFSIPFKAVEIGN